ncbi:FMN-linked oxidoreductase [Massarina eburnea CBS 473.64]|uniref:FMN-linked oxidoreductase n=1 Tax=Massarina eburnea CBS 473.64 TaxID=1395130 RepID=A0A6A6SAJ6_9PLEO|nr:FMN-linked oxidoreductase [Massarina eburnea CBS 473.64]
MSDSRLFQPLKLGNIQLEHRVAMAPLTRFRANDDHVPLPIVAEYYAQRASVPGTLLISEATFISPEAGGYANAPGIYNQTQIDAWKKVTDAVHEKGSFIYLQLWNLGRAAGLEQTKKEGVTIKSSSAVAMEGGATPVAMTKEDIKNTIAAYAQAAKNSIAAGFDGVEIHAANGYLIDQFTQDTANQRTDDYGGSIENRSRFAVEVTKAVAEAVGAEKTGIRFSPFSPFQSMGMKEPIPQFSDLIKKVSPLNLAYIHLVESRISGNADVEASERLDPLIDLCSGPIVLAGGFKPDSAKSAADKDYPKKDVVLAFGRYFLSTPDLVFRLKEGIPFNSYDRDGFYAAEKKEGYTDYPFSEQFLAANAKAKA